MIAFEPMNISEQYRIKEEKNDLFINKGEFVFTPVTNEVTCTISNSSVIPGINDKNSTIDFKRVNKNGQQSFYKE